MEKEFLCHYVKKLPGQLAKLKKETKIDLGIVVGAGNIFRGRFAASNPNSKTNKTKDEFNMTIAHQMGMVATLLNGLALEECLENIGVKTRLMTALPMDAVVEPYFVKKPYLILKRESINFSWRNR